MVNYQPDRLGGIFSALSDPTRRAVLARLSEQAELSVTTLAEPFAMSLPAVLKHLDVLEGAGLIERRKTGRTVSCRLNAAPMQEAQDWLARYARFWTTRLDALERYLAEADVAHAASSDAPSNPTPPPNAETMRCPPPPKPHVPSAKSRASPSRASSRRRRNAASAPGPIRKP
jgi:DNA-binding transcriptional ArsR family regulator